MDTRKPFSRTASIYTVIPCGIFCWGKKLGEKPTFVFKFIYFDCRSVGRSSSSLRQPTKQPTNQLRNVLYESSINFFILFPPHISCIGRTEKYKESCSFIPYLVRVSRLSVLSIFNQVPFALRLLFFPDSTQGGIANYVAFLHFPAEKKFHFSPCQGKLHRSKKKLGKKEMKGRDVLGLTKHKARSSHVVALRAQVSFLIFSKRSKKYIVLSLAIIPFHGLNK